MPLRVSCRGPALRLVSSGGVTQSIPPNAWLCVARPLVAGPVRQERSGTPGIWGGAVCLPPSIGGVVGSGLVGGRQGAEGERLLCLSPSLCLPGTGTKAGFAGVAQSMEGVVSILLPFVSVRSRLGAV